MREALREIVAARGKLSIPIEALDDNADLFAAGMDSLAVVDIMLAIEEQFGVELPDAMLTRRSFSSIAAMDEAFGLVPNA